MKSHEKHNIAIQRININVQVYALMFLSFSIVVGVVGIISGWFYRCINAQFTKYKILFLLQPKMNLSNRR